MARSPRFATVAGMIRTRWSAVRARMLAGRLDIELANGADPWSSADLMRRAARLCSLGERGKLAAALAGLVEVARAPRPTFSARVPIRHGLVLENADELLLLAGRIEQLEPVDVASLANLALLVRDGKSPVYAGGRPPNEFTRVIARALHAVDQS